MESVKVGDVLPFKVNNQMVPFEVIQKTGSILKIRSCDLLWEAEITIDMWLKQKHILEERCQNERGRHRIKNC